MFPSAEYVPPSFFCPAPFNGGLTLTDVCPASKMAVFFTLLNSLFHNNPKIGAPCGRIIPVEKPHFSYDFVVIGGGAAGSVVASRLSEIPHWNVLLIEAGPDEPSAAEVPSLFLSYLGGELDWNYFTSDEANACLSNKGRCKWPRGKNLGGNTVHHGMAYHRGNAKDYNRWAKMGNPGWSWKEVLPFFYMGEDNREIGRVQAKHHGIGGPMNVERFRWQPQTAWDILAAANETGYGIIEDLVGDKLTGFSIAQTLSKDGVRQSTAAAYLRPIRHRHNLHILLNATASQLIITNKKVTGVKYIKNGETHAVRVKREVIVAGGTINSPQLLLLSGIGPRDELAGVGVKPVHNLPGVGKNLHNHVSFALDFYMNEPDDFLLNSKNAQQYLNNQSGPLSSSGLAQVTGIIQTKYAEPDDPDLQMFFSGYQATCAYSDSTSFKGKRTLRITPVNLHSKSRGVIRLQSKNPLAHPYIWSNELGHPEDVEVLLEGVHVAFKLANSTVMKKKGLTLIEKVIPECAKYGFGSDDYWRCAIRYDTRAENHQVGTCKMGPARDPLAVVDARLRVHGIKGLRVADASIMPKVVSGNPVAPVNMIGEVAAVRIKEDHFGYLAAKQ